MSKSSRFKEAQLWVTYLINGRYLERIPYGQESNIETEDPNCEHCNVQKGQLHILGCCVDQCPSCGFTAIKCECEAYSSDLAEELEHQLAV